MGQVFHLDKFTLIHSMSLKSFFISPNPLFTPLHSAPMISSSLLLMHFLNFGNNIIFLWSLRAKPLPT